MRHLLGWPLLLTLLLLAGCTMRGDYTAVIQEEATGLAGEIYGAKTIGQTFRVSRNNLARIDLPIHYYGRANHQPLLLHLVEITGEPIPAAPQAREAVRVEMPPAAINRNGYTRVTFPPIADSAGKSYYLYLESPDSSPGDAMTVYYNVADVYSQGEMVIDGRPAAGDLAFRVYTAEHFTVGGVWHDFSSRAAGDAGFFAFYAALLAAVAGALVWTWRLPEQRRAGNEQND